MRILPDRWVFDLSRTSDFDRLEPFGIGLPRRKGLAYSGDRPHVHPNPLHKWRTSRLTTAVQTRFSWCGSSKRTTCNSNLWQIMQEFISPSSTRMIDHRSFQNKDSVAIKRPHVNGVPLHWLCLKIGGTPHDDPFKGSGNRPIYPANGEISGVSLFKNTPTRSHRGVVFSPIQ